MSEFDAWGLGLIVVAVVSVGGSIALALTLSRWWWAALLPALGIVLLVTLGAGMNPVSALSVTAAGPALCWVLGKERRSRHYDPTLGEPEAA